MIDLPMTKLIEGMSLWDHQDKTDAQPAVRAFAAKTWHRLNVRDMAFNALRGLALDAQKRIAKFNRVKAESLDHSEEDVAQEEKAHA